MINRSRIIRTIFFLLVSSLFYFFFNRIRQQDQEKFLASIQKERFDQNKSDSIKGKIIQRFPETVNDITAKVYFTADSLYFYELDIYVAGNKNRVGSGNFKTELRNTIYLFNNGQIYDAFIRMYCCGFSLKDSLEVSANMIFIKDGVEVK